jgi:hypothetical protein
MTVVHGTAPKGLKNVSDSSTDQDAPPVPSELDIDVHTIDRRPNVAEDAKTVVSSTTYYTALSGRRSQAQSEDHRLRA